MPFSAALMRASVFIEAESNKVGQIHIPAALWAAMRGAVSVVGNTKIEHRVAASCAGITRISLLSRRA